MSNLIRHTLEKSDHVLVITHVDPDGDAIGSLTAVGQAVKQLGLRVTLACDDRVPSRFRYLAMSSDVQRSADPRIAYDLLFAVDCGDEQRMGDVYADLPNPRPFIINIDHHITNTRFGDINVVKPEATSTVEVLYGLFLEWGIEITPEIATSLLTGLVTDTIGFRTVGVTANTLRTAADLVDAGADIGFVSLNALNMRAFSTMKLWSIGMDKMHLDDGFIWTAITNQEQEEVGYHSSSSVGLTSLLSDVEEAVMSAVLMEGQDGMVKVSLRCRPPYNVSEVAVKLGGGGHALASGCTLPGPLAEAEATIVQSCKEAIKEQSQEIAAVNVETAAD
ncbi:MAG: DHH family phosphoesterase [Candidatus Promineifilaceae bacterium]